ncbi:LysR family transcriptional regulator [Shimazuella sp. AN120528]|uniref:LysR family transcriptional regulator n=1 Tax=Shimazuella soli TaxID=1892854 RepID=UPI001F0DB734|nr:LysR family transcriptional regulator [Shimazuella soli]MCH5585596.1 LysR family transcriptional regulator [Shimazuella soli]
MELLQLQYFRKVAQLGHLTRAAEELRIAQPALSKTIARLENDLGVPLFDRKKRQIRLNEYGQIFLKQVEIALGALEEGKQQIADQANLIQGRVILASTDHQCDAELVRSFLTMFPDNKLLIKQTYSEIQNQTFLRNGDIDFYITSLPIDNNDLDSYPFVTEEIFLGVPKSHKLANRSSIRLIEFAEEDFISLPTRNHFRQITDHYCNEAGFTPQSVCEVEELSAVSSFVQKEIGVAFLTQAVTHPEIVLLPIEEPVCKRTFQIVWMKNRYLSKSALKFQEFLIYYYQKQEKETNQTP